MNTKEINILALAYMGDAVIETHVRQRLINQGTVKPHELHKRAVDYVSANAQAAYLRSALDKSSFTDAEIAVIRRGRNAKSASKPKNTDMQAYQYSTAFEALIGTLYFENQQERLKALLEALCHFTEERRPENER